jgi:hypothetical protein
MGALRGPTLTPWASSPLISEPNVKFQKLDNSEIGLDKFKVLKTC